MGTESLSEQIGGLGRYDESTLNLEDKEVTWHNRNRGKGLFGYKDDPNKFDALEAFTQKDPRLEFFGFIDPNEAGKDSAMGRLLEQHPTWKGRSVYQFNTGELWKEDDYGFDPDLHRVGAMKFVYWSP